jgi:hypothetical protein
MRFVCRTLTGLLLLFATRAEGQSELRGRVVTESGTPIVGATVTLGGVRYSVTTDSLGQFILAGTPGSTLSLTLKADGYREDAATVILARGRPTTRDFILRSDDRAIPEETGPQRLQRIRVVTTDNDPIAYANIQVNGGRRFVSDDSGRASVAFNPAGPVTLLVRRIGFEPTEIQLAAAQDSVIRVQMTAVATTLERQVVTVRSPFIRLDLGGFYRRMAEVQNGARVGYFLTPEDLALRRPQNVTDAVEHFPTIRLAPIDDGKVGTDGLYHADGAQSRRKFRIEDRNGCPLTVYVDRVRVQPAVAGGKFVDEEINSLINPQTIAGIEVYPRALGAPPEFPAVNTSSMVECGVVLIWTK